MRPQPSIPYMPGKNHIQSRPKRSFSQSTVDDQLASERLETGAFRIVIDRAETVSRPDTSGSKKPFPSIEVPIPHYRLGTPRFSARGTAFLHQSVYTRSSEHESSALSVAEYDRMFPKPPGIEPHTVISRRHSHASPQPYSLQTTSSGGLAPPVNIHPSHLHQSRSPIIPQIYDALARNPDDPAIVKYSPINGEIIAASPARIIAQITSENFLDYELLSDFFLTVRSYLSTSDLLAYLLARFEWAINRFDDNGRVIRVRAFAALRHWILNYFSYDFVVDRDLRVRFCDRLNALTRIVKARANYGASDMKLIVDLKKCWNGRCALYWDNPIASGEAQKENDIQPGGILGSRDSHLVHPSQLRTSTVSTAYPPPATNPLQLATGAPSIAGWYSTVMEHGDRRAHGHVRQASTATSRSLPISPISDQSAPVLSCSIPAKGFKRVVPYANKALGIHPVPSSPEGRRVCPAAPSSLSNEPGPPRPVGENRRSGSFSDAARDKRAPLSSDMPNAGEAYGPELATDRSLLRGNAIPPGSPFVNATLMTPATEFPPVSTSSTQTKETEPSTSRRLMVSNSPAVKSLLGNIRRALSSKHNGHNTPAHNAANNATLGPSSQPLGVSKSATMPLNVMFQSPATQGQAERNRGQLRVDMLAAEVADAFQQHTNPPPAIDPSNVGIALGNEREQPSPFGTKGSPPDSNGHLRAPELRRLASGVTDSSQSILIVDDTGLNMPGLHGLYAAHINGGSTPRVNAHSDPVSPVVSEIPLVNVHHTNFHDSASAPQASVSELSPSEIQDSQGSERVVSPVEATYPLRPPELVRNLSTTTSKSNSMSLRRYASFQSTFTKHGQGKSIDATTTSASDSTHTTAKEVPARMLRRRPGGDLRAIENVHDLEEMTRPKSAGSITTYSESIRGSQLLGFGEKITRTFTGRKTSKDRERELLLATQFDNTNKSPSYVRTHSSQGEQRRPSFEAAVAEFARIPDDEEGGIEATLLKLEGKYQKSPVQSPIPQTFAEVDSQLANNSSPKSDQQSAEEKKKNRNEQIGDSDVSVLPITPPNESSDDNSQETTPQRVLPLTPKNEPREAIVSTIYADSEDSYNSVPLLERGVDESSPREPKGKERAVRPLFNPEQMTPGDAVFETNSLRRLKYGSTAPTATTDSFLLDENDEFLSDLSSELSMDTIEGEQVTEQWPEGSRGEKEDMVLIGQQHPPSPPMTMENALAISSQAHHVHDQRKPPTPDPSPVSQDIDSRILQGKSTAPKSLGLGLQRPRHLCFIMAYDSEVLAQQFAIIEKDALKEVDWRDLVDMRWQNSAAATTNWVEYLLSQDPLGIDLVTARFNIMVKWAISEIILTEIVDERAATIVKYIHIAHQSRRIHNYATLLQLTIALTSTDCTRLSKTWDIVPQHERDLLQDLEMLVSPRRNFHNLRQEMEKANTEEGIIPVVGEFDQPF